MTYRMATVGIIFLTTLLGHSYTNSIVHILAQDRIFPTVVVPIPVQPLPPEITPTLEQDRIYVAKSNDPFILVSSPQKSINVNIVNGPIAIYGKFADTPNKTIPELRTFSEQYICIVTPTPSSGGLVELIAVPVGIKTADQLQRITLQLGPIPPPPVPPTPVPPGPTPVPPTPVTEFRVIVVYDMAIGYPAPIQRILDSKKIREYLSAKVTKTNDQPDWRFWDVDAPLATTVNKPLADMFNEKKADLETNGIRKSPLIIIRKNGVTTLVPIADTEDKTLDLLKSYGG